MKEEKSLIYSLTILLYALIYFLIIIKLFPNIAALLSCIFILLLTFIKYKKYKLPKNINTSKRINKKSILYISIAIFIYFTVVFILGLITGYRLSAYSHSILKILKRTFLPFASMVLLEIYRYISINNYKKKKNIILETILIMIFDIVIHYYRLDGTLVDLFVFSSVVVLPLILKNFLLTYITKNIGLKQCLIYVIPLGLYTYFIPVYPDLGNYLTCIVNMTLPSFVYIYLNRMLTEEDEIEHLEDDKNKINIKKILRVLLDTLLVIIFTVFIALISDQFPYQLIGVEESNIAPLIERGDAIIIYKNVVYDEYNAKDIIAYRNNKKIIIDVIEKVEIDNVGQHHIYVKKEIKDNKVVKYTEIPEENMIGVYENKKIKKIAYPTIKFNELIKGDVNEKR